MSRLTNNEGKVRKMLALALSVAVQAAALGAPFVHAHPDEHATGHHAGRAVHTHWAGHSHHSPDGPVLGTADHDRAVFVNAFVAVAMSVFHVPMVAPDTIDLPVPAEREAHRAVDIAHGHDPPVFRSLPSRAPPAFLS